MDKKSYTIIDRFNCCNKAMVTVIIDKNVSVMTESDYNKMLFDEKRRKRYRV